MSRQEAMALLNLTKKPPARSTIRRSQKTGAQRNVLAALLKPPVNEQDGR